MQENYYYKCDICGSISNLKYQMGYSKRHPIRYKCNCGVTIRGEYLEGQGINIENAEKHDQCTPNFVVHSSGEFLTQTQYSVTNFEDTIAPTTFLIAMQRMDYEKFRDNFSAIINYRDNANSMVKAINELYENENLEMLEKVIRNNYDPKEELFPLNNEADYLRAVTMINQFQFLLDKGTTKIVTDLFLSSFRAKKDECIKYFNFLSSLEKIPEWKRRIYHIADQIYTKIDLLIPAIGIDFYYDKSLAFSGNLSITTTSFEDIKQLYVDLYELISSLLIIPIGFDNILLRNSYESINIVKGINIKDLTGISKMKKKGNIIKLLDTSAPFESLIFKNLNNDIRNSIGHFSYKSEEIANSRGQTVRFYSLNDNSKFTDVSLIEICYDIWNMYKCLGVFNELIHHIELHILAHEKHIFPSFITNARVRNKMQGFESNKKKIFPSDPCPCGSGLNYKNCCRRKKRSA